MLKIFLCGLGGEIYVESSLDFFYDEFKEVPLEIYQIDQMVLMGHLTEKEAQERAFYVNIDYYLRGVNNV